MTAVKVCEECKRISDDFQWDHDEPVCRCEKCKYSRLNIEKEPIDE